MKFFDPACGCGNFLIIAYRELRELEIDLIRELRRGRGDEAQRMLDATDLSQITVDQFYGIEIGEFPVRIAETAMWMMDHIMNNRLSLAFGQSYVRIPLEGSPHILNADALETDWTDLLPPEDCSYVFGNPPFGGAKFQSEEQRAQVRRIAALGKSGGTLDYVTAWFIKAGEYVQTGRSRIGFVATNSITQGEQVAQLWPLLFARTKLAIAFAHRTFAWGSDARGKAHVHVVIIGFDGLKTVRVDKRLFSYPDIKGEPEETLHAALSPYLFDAGGLADPHLTVREESRPINGLAQLFIGSKPIDGGHYIFTAEERAALLAAEPNAESFLRPFVGAREYLQGGERWILALHDAPPATLARLPQVKKRIVAVREYREGRESKPTQELAKTPTLYHVNVLPTVPFLVIPEVSSERREYVPIGWLEPPVIPSNLVRVLENATLADFALLTSAMHMAWLRHVGGRLESRYRYSIGLVYNTFPPPPKRNEPVETGAAGASRARCPRRPSGRNAGRPLRSRPDAAQSSPGAPSPRPRGGPALPSHSLHVRTRARRTSVCSLRAAASSAGCAGCRYVQRQTAYTEAEEYRTVNSLRTPLDVIGSFWPAARPVKNAYPVASRSIPAMEEDWRLLGRSMIRRK